MTRVWFAKVFSFAFCFLQTNTNLTCYSTLLEFVYFRLSTEFFRTNDYLRASTSARGRPNHPQPPPSESILMPKVFALFWAHPDQRWIESERGKEERTDSALNLLNTNCMREDDGHGVSKDNIMNRK